LITSVEETEETREGIEGGRGRGGVKVGSVDILNFLDSVSKIESLIIGELIGRFLLFSSLGVLKTPNDSYFRSQI
jgi:hypothetical protein